MNLITTLPETTFRTVSALIRKHAQHQPQRTALRDDQGELSYAQLDALMNRIAAALQRDGVRPGQSIAICAHSSVHYAALFLGALRAGIVVAPLAPSASQESLAAMLQDAGAQWLFLDSAAHDMVPPDLAATRCVRLDGAPAGIRFEDWLAAEGVQPQPVDLLPEAPFNIIYSSGTTGTPKGIVQSHGMRWAHVQRGSAYGYSPEGTTLLATPLYSNTTLVVFFPTLGFGGCVELMPKFDAARYLQLAEQRRATHTMLVPVQYQRIMALPQFGEHDLSAFQYKFCTSAPFSAVLKSDVLARWPGGLVEFYGMTEGGGTCILVAHEHPDKLHTVGQPAATSDIRLIDEDGRELPLGATGEVVGHSPGMMTGYHGRPDLTREAEWFDVGGKRFIRTGDVGRFDAEGFLTLLDRRKDMIISGGFNIYPSDLEAELRLHPAVEDVAVTGVPSERWGETPVAFVRLRPGACDEAAQIMAWYNTRAGKTQRLTALHFIEELPRSPIGKVLKRELRVLYLNISN
ncbi:MULTISPECIES: class I adenylate-forming enzyme family protein [unclassified Polaromonas]|uniref:class I adenylate-forming enzyme family protein n=1 Tax=unclassified Polaromonas TaxID=2638319 RepID=UPI0018CB98EA|nr:MULTISPECIES: class I adenylate-forming enzyme family protein [unclassified Polaromonas]MBG6074148.1 acyl-CoA synthetase (AMP-forming)/AMP-acid ligase II [Polaromonas sp. CG_9.7]MBG6116147.1 acyl-CoA synthetase (AMP-forming)/AMP-acid ligase II [Polaromonas sp. CG_9.2]MDH6185105.1 acyl-CoA synthetase (AMP-forming)/AMP-acid ligase II [Polaromonas sp. CG_23.6]